MQNSQTDKHSDFYGNGCCRGITPLFPYPLAKKLPDNAKKAMICVYSFLYDAILTYLIVYVNNKKAIILFKNKDFLALKHSFYFTKQLNIYIIFILIYNSKIMYLIIFVLCSYGYQL